MFRTLPMIAAIATSVVVLGGSIQPAFAQAPAVRAVPAVALASNDTFVAGDVLWNCASDGCTTRGITTRPVVACAQVVKKIGRVDSFAVGGAPLSADDLAKCNAKAKGGATAVATAQ